MKKLRNKGLVAVIQVHVMHRLKVMNVYSLTSNGKRKALDWDAMYGICLDREKAMEYRARGCTEKEDGCSMCGDICAVKIVNSYLTK